MTTAKVTAHNLGTLRSIKKSGRTVHVFGNKVYIGKMNAVRLSMFHNLVHKGLMSEIKGKRNHYEITEAGHEALEKYG